MKTITEIRELEDERARLLREREAAKRHQDDWTVSVLDELLNDLDRELMVCR